MARSSATAKGRRAAIVAGLRTPFVKAGTDFAQLDVLDLARAVTVELLQRTGLDPNHVDHVIYGNVTRPVQYTNLARELVLAAGLPKRTPADTVTLACASACQAITDATNLIERGYADVVVAGGVEMLSNVPIALSPPLARALVSASQARSIGARLQSFRHLGLADLPPVAPTITETSTGLSMGQSAELMAKLNGISRADQDAWALGSHRKAAAAWEDGRMQAEVAPVYVVNNGGRAVGSRQPHPPRHQPGKTCPAEAGLRPPLRHGDRRQLEPADGRRGKRPGDVRRPGARARHDAESVCPLVRVRRGRPRRPAAHRAGVCDPDGARPGRTEVE